MLRPNRQLPLPDVRRLGYYDEYSSSHGKPVYCFRGSPSSRLDLFLFGADVLL
jgi:hypothetical protein